VVHIHDEEVTHGVWVRLDVALADGLGSRGAVNPLPKVIARQRPEEEPKLFEASVRSGYRHRLHSCTPGASEGGFPRRVQGVT